MTRGAAGHAAGDRAEAALAVELDDPQRQPPPRQPRQAEGRRPPGVLRLGRHHDDRALLRRAAAGRPGRGQAAREPDLPRRQYLLGREPVEQLQRFRALGGAQSYPSRTKDKCGVDFSTGSVGLGAAMTLFASLTQDYVRAARAGADRTSRRAAWSRIVGDAELDEGNIFEALLEGWKYDVRNVWWVIDYNRQSLDRVVPERLFAKIEEFFARGRLAGRHPQVRQAAAGGVRPARRRGAARLDRRLPERSLLRADLQGRRRLARASGERPRPHPGIRALLDGHDDAALARADDQSRRPRPRGRARGVPRRRRTIGRTASSPTRSRASACRSPATRTTMPG